MGGGGTAAWADAHSFVACDLLTINLADLPTLPSHGPRFAAYFRAVERCAETEAAAQHEAQVARSRRLEAMAGMGDLEVSRWLDALLISHFPEPGADEVSITNHPGDGPVCYR